MDNFVLPEEAEGLATYEMANLRPDTTGLPFVVWTSQRAGAPQDVRAWSGHIRLWCTAKNTWMR